MEKTTTSVPLQESWLSIAFTHMASFFWLPIMAQVAVALGRHVEGEECLLGSAQLPSEGWLSSWDTGAGWPALSEK